MYTWTILLRRHLKCFSAFLLIYLLIQIIFGILFYQIIESNIFIQRLHFNNKQTTVVTVHSLIDNIWPINALEIDDQKFKLKVQTNEINKSDEELLTCNTTDSFLISAIERAKTEHCREQIKHVFCRHQAGRLYSETIINQNRCPVAALFKHIGCYLNNRRPSTIDSFVYQYRKANELRCSYLCTQLNTRYFGIENATFCHCFTKLPSEQLIIDSSLCNTFCDSKTKLYRCGAPYLISVYETGVIEQKQEMNESKFDVQKVKVDMVVQKSKIRIAFLYSVNGRSIRQIKRLIKQMYDRRHIYFVHVDKQSDFLFNSLVDELGDLNNLIVTNERFNTIWGGSHLLAMLLNSFKLLLNYKWEYVINLSESDYPIKSLSSLEKYLQRFRGKNFLKFHGQNNDAFVRKQGLQVLFLQCENKMWRLNKKRNLIREISFTGGSDWFALHRSFVNFIINGSNHSVASNLFLNNLKQFFNHTLLPAESFFHTLLQNSEYCTQLINNNLRITNWKRKIGCKCQYKHIVDWCGCSPNIYRTVDLFKLKSEFDKPLFFARKFDPLIDHEIINQIESSYNSASPVNLHKYWHNLFHFKYDDRTQVQVTYALLSVIAMEQLFSICSIYDYQLMSAQNLLKAVALSNVNLFINQGNYVGTQISFNFTHANRLKVIHLKLEILVSHHHYLKQYDDIDSALRLVSLQVCTEYDVKENFFRNFGCLINSESRLIVQHRWKYLNYFYKLPGDYKIRFVWIHEMSKQFTFENEIDLSELLIASKTSQINSYFEVPYRKPIQPGKWKLLLVSRIGKRIKRRINNLNSKIDKSNKLNLHFDKSIDGLYNSISEQNVTLNVDLKTKFDELLNDIMIGDQERMQSRLIAETQFLVFDSRSNSNKLKYREVRQVLKFLKSSWQVKDICINDNQNSKLTGWPIDECGLTIKNCLNTTWSSTLPDPKSHLSFH